MKSYTPTTAPLVDSLPDRPGTAPGFGAPEHIPDEINAAHGWRKAVAFDHSRVLLPQFVFKHGQKLVPKLYRLSLDEGEPRAAAGPLVRLWAALVYAFVVLRQILIYYRRYGSFVRQRSGITSHRQLRDLWYCAWRQNQSPRHYYWRKLYLVPDRKDWLDYLEHRQVNTLLNHLNRRLPITKATNKARFYEHCVKHNLPTAPVLAAWNKTGQLTSATPAPVTADVFLKRANDFGSVGILPIVYQAATGTHRLKNRDLTWPDLLNAISGLARADDRPMILQRRLRNAPRNAIYGDADICNVRIVTGRAPGREPEAVSAFIRLPSSLTTTGHDRNIMISSIDVATGLMEPGRFREIKLDDFPKHPDTGAQIEGRILPGWNDMVELAKQGHRTYPWLPFIGWDVVDTTDGLLLLEANAYWGGDCVQLPGATPLGRTPFPEIYFKCFEHFYGTDLAHNR
jgi:Sugar-transfer associated ATP-grasp